MSSAEKPAESSSRHSLLPYPPGAEVSQLAMTDGWPIRVYRQPPRLSAAQGNRARGSILWLGGRGDFFEKYLETLDGWAGAGWSVTSFDWRGQGGSGRLGPNPNVGHIDDFAIWVEDLASFWSQWIRETPGPHHALAHSMGGHLLLRAIAQGRITPQSATLIAPMLGIDSAVPFFLARRAATLLARRFGPGRRAWRDNERPSARNQPRQAYLTRDAHRYAEELAWWRRRPELRLGPPSWPWVAAAYQSTAALIEPGVLESVRTPLLLIATEGDGLVSPAAIRRFADRIPGAELMMFPPEVAHEILREIDGVRAAALKRIDTFLDTHSPALR